MRGLRRIGLMVVSLASMFALIAASVFAAPQVWTSKAETTLLRDVNATPKHQPDALALVNNGNVELKTTVGTIACGEVELGSTVVSNTETLAKLALPFGVAEGDGCKVGGTNVPTYFDTLASGAVGNAANGNVASVTVNEPKAGELAATVNDLKLSHNVPGVGFCTSDLNGIKGTITNVVAEFVEEKPPNLNVQFTKAKVPITGTGCPTEGEFTANFLLETSSTTTDTAFIGGAPCLSAPAVTFGKENETKLIIIANCSKIVRVDIIEVSTTNEAEFKAGKKCANVPLATEGDPGDTCTEQVTFMGKCATPPASAELVVEILQRGMMFKSKLTGC